MRPTRRLVPLGSHGRALVVCSSWPCAFVLVRSYTLRASVLPGVRVAGVDIGGMSRPDAPGPHRDRHRRAPAPAGRHRDRRRDVHVTPEQPLTRRCAPRPRVAYEAARDSFLDRSAPSSSRSPSSTMSSPSSSRTDRARRAREGAREATTARCSALVAMDGRDRSSSRGATGPRRPCRRSSLAADAAPPRCRLPDGRDRRPGDHDRGGRAGRREAQAAVSRSRGSRFRHTRVGSSGRTRLAQLIRFDAAAAPRAVAGRQGPAHGARPARRAVPEGAEGRLLPVSGKRVHVVKGPTARRSTSPEPRLCVLAAATSPERAMRRSSSPRSSRSSPPPRRARSGSAARSPRSPPTWGSRLPTGSGTST